MGLCQQLLRQQQPTSQDKFHGRHAKLLLHNAPQLPRAELQVRRDFLKARSIIHMPFINSLHYQMRDALRIVHGRTARCQLGTTAKTGAECGLLRRLRALKEPAVLTPRSFDRTDRPAIDARGGNSNKEHSIETRVP